LDVTLNSGSPDDLVVRGKVMNKIDPVLLSLLAAAWFLQACGGGGGSRIPAQTPLVPNGAANSVTRYSVRAAGDLRPGSTISGGRTQLDEPQDVSVGRNGEIYVANDSGSVTIFPVSSSGDYWRKRGPDDGL
jgi:hypothetical protein